MRVDLGILHIGQYNNSLGYHNNTGRVYTSWKVHANTLGLQYGKGIFFLFFFVDYENDLFRKYGRGLCDLFW